MDQTDSDQQDEKNAPPRKGKVTKKTKKGKNTQGVEIIDCEDCETTNPGTKSTTSELPIRYTDGKLSIAEGKQGKNTTNVSHVAETSLVSDQKSHGIPDGMQLVMTQVTQMFQQVMQQSQQQSQQMMQQQMEGQAQMVQMVRTFMSEHPMANVPSSSNETKPIIDQGTHTFSGNEGKGHLTYSGNEGRKRVSMASSKELPSKDTPGKNVSFESNASVVHPRYSHESDMNYDDREGKGKEMSDENPQSNESTDSNGSTSDDSDDNSHIWRTKPSRRRKRKNKRENKFLVLSDPFTSVTAFNSKTLTPPFREWYNTEYRPVALQAGLSDQESCKKMRSHMDYAAKQAYDIATEIHGYDLVQVCQYMHSKFKSSEKLTMAALHSRKMSSTESVTEYALQLQTMYGIIRPSASNNKRERELAPIFRHGIPKGLLDECNMYPYPKTLAETIEQVKHREKRWREKQNATNQRIANVRNTYVPNPIAYTGNGQQQVLDTDATEGGTIGHSANPDNIIR